MNIILCCTETDSITEVYVQDMQSLFDSAEHLFGDVILSHNNKKLTRYNSLDALDLLQNNIINIENNKNVHNNNPHIPNHIYIKGEINDYCFKIIVDSGAERTMMCYTLAQHLELDSYIDRSYKGIVQGVGTMAMVGIIKACNIKLAPGFYFPVDITVVEMSDPSIFLLGVDFLFPSKCVIDFVDKAIYSKLSKTEVHKMPFLSNSEVNELQYPINNVKNKIQQSYTEMINSLPYNLKNNITSILKKIIINIINNPYNSKYKRINMESKLFSIVLTNNSCIKFMEQVGFKEKVEEQGKYFYFSETDNILHTTNSVLCSY
jgi:hypothetical protein